MALCWKPDQYLSSYSCSILFVGLPASGKVMKLTTTWVSLLSISTLAASTTTTFDTRASQHPAPTPNPHTKPTVKATPHGTPSKSSASAGHTGGSDGNWKQLGCKDPSTTNEDMDVKQRWEKAGAPHAWEDAVHNFDEHDKKEDVDFSKSVSDYFHGPPNVFCGKSLGQETNCKEVPDCNSAGSHTFNTSAGYLIMRSMVTWNQVSLFLSMLSYIILVLTQNRLSSICSRPSAKPTTTST